MLVKRKNLYQSCWHGAPGLLSPVNFLEEKGHQGLAVAVFGILFSSLCMLVLDNDPLPFIASSTQHNREYWKIMALLYYPAFYYPLIACATVRHRAGYLLGCLLSWCHCVVHIWQKADCPQSPKIYRYYSLLSYLPVIFCLMVLSLWYPALLVRSFTEWEVGAWGPKSLSLGLDEREDEGREFLGFPLVTSHPSACNPEARMIDWLTSDFGIAGFQVPLKLVLSVTMAVIAVYQVALLLLVAFIPNIQIIRAGMTKEITVLLVQFGLIPSENAGGIPGDMEKELATVKHYLWALEVCYVCSLVISCLLTFCMLMRSLVMHRMNLQSLYRGAVLDVFYHPHELRPSQQSLVCWMSFASFQTAFTCLGLLIQQIIFFICTVGFTFLVAIPLRSGTNMHLFKIVENMWQFWLTLVVAVILQHLVTHYYFLERDRLPKELTNRRALYILTYLLFPINVLVGVLAGVWRMVISALYNAIHFCQLDISLLNRSVELFDPGYRTYCHYLKIEVSQSHPVMKAFCFLLLQLPSPEGQTVLKPTDVEEGIQLMQTKKVSPKVSKSKQSRARWCLAYTLLNNPSLLPLRKTVLADPTANGTQNSPAKP
uniref:Receptor for retinol uptake STRA6 n=1 Tax=Sphenodon punctatus TaxID=8508 RepID=A0A8D0L4N7_SPHPU